MYFIYITFFSQLLWDSQFCSLVLWLGENSFSYNLQICFWTITTYCNWQYNLKTNLYYSGPDTWPKVNLLFEVKIEFANFVHTMHVFHVYVECVDKLTTITSKWDCSGCWCCSKQIWPTFNGSSCMFHHQYRKLFIGICFLLDFESIKTSKIDRF